MTLGIRTLPSPGSPSAALSRVNGGVVNGAMQKSAPTVGCAIPPQATSGWPVTLTEFPMTPLSGKHGRFLNTHVWFPAGHSRQVPVGGELQSFASRHVRNLSIEQTPSV